MTVQLAGSHMACLARWRRVVAAYPNAGAGLAALSFQSLKPPQDGLIPLQWISAALLCVEPARRKIRPLQFSFFGATAIPYGIEWGGVERSKLTKDLRLRPRMSAQGRRMDLTRVRTLHLGLDLYAAIVSATENELMDHLQIPQCWMGFESGYDVDAEGPEVVGMMHAVGMSSQQLMMRVKRQHDGLHLYPMEWTSHRWMDLKQIFVEIGSVPVIQVLRCTDPSETLVGYRGAVSFDFLSTAYPDPRQAHAVED